MRLQFGTDGTAASGIAPAALGTGAAGRRIQNEGASGSVDQISLSPAYTILNRHESTRAVRLQQLTQLVREGNYQISSQALSSRIVSASLNT